MHDADAVGHGQRFLLVMRHQDERDAEGALQPHQLLAGVAPEVAIQCGQRFVEQQQRRPRREAACQRDALLLAAGQLCRLAGGKSAKADQFQHVRHARIDLGPLQAMHAQAEADICGNRHMREQRVRLEHGVHWPSVRRQCADVTSVQHDATGVGLHEPADRAQQCRLAGAGAAEQHEQFAWCDAQVEAIHRCCRAEPDGQAS